MKRVAGFGVDLLDSFMVGGWEVKHVYSAEYGDIYVMRNRRRWIYGIVVFDSYGANIYVVRKWDRFIDIVYDLAMSLADDVYTADRIIYEAMDNKLETLV